MPFPLLSRAVVRALLLALLLTASVFLSRVVVAAWELYCLLGWAEAALER